MSIEIVAVVLVAATLHAGWNTLIKISGDRVAVMAFVTLAGSLISLLFLPLVEAPDPASWPLLGLTILLHTGYHFFLPVAYDHGDLGQVYPMARGSAPLLVTVGALVFAGESLGPWSVVGVISLAVGVTALTFDKTGVSRVSIDYANSSVTRLRCAVPLPTPAETAASSTARKEARRRIVPG